ncbi:MULTISPECIES: hypothetical protein [Staphylococcaceae]|uniref:DUF5590 domain-containing protein n=1 Tax=Macrococcus psychrotolerans TaxID=3039389 RepID=A0AAU6R7M0_9STAP|nr:MULTISPECIES: hypothetical protein [Macrococcus]MDJ1112488.1 hypothetical protein [Macrococcus sp. S115]PKE11703.1 hypothetical protein CW685_06400 [Macrococcus caseolyticus]PKE17353.1 hypothetical protein CW718_04320 [Macrococcus caseolyticus]PKE46830.1 hypothetical protein CW677_10545 [Macrococcus caseolyticus]PKE61145.1 hypothetical protein CW669_04890 [Macrococcus caseolyticus]
MKKYIFTIIGLFIIFVSGMLVYNYCTTPDNDLSQERIGNYMLHQHRNVLLESFKEDDNAKVEGKSFYRSDALPGLIISVSNKKQQISALILYRNDKLYTERNIGIGDSKAQVIEAYGTTYKKSILNNRQTQYHYMDKENHIGMKFIFKDNKVKRIELFDA